MLDFFSDDMRRDPFGAYDQVRVVSPVFRVPPPFDAYLIFDYDGVKRALYDQEAFSNAVPSPPNWFIFTDPPHHTKLRALISRAFTPRTVAALETRIGELSRNLLAPLRGRDRIDLASEYSVPLPMMVIADLVGIPRDDWETYRRWSDGILKLSYTRGGGEEAAQAQAEFVAITAEMAPYVAEMIECRRAAPQNDLLTRLVEAEVDGEGLSHPEILGFFQLLVVGGQETTANLINNAMLCFLEHPEELARLRSRPELLPTAIEEVLRYRAPLQWVMRTPRREVELHGAVIPPGKLVLPMIGSANRDPAAFLDAGRFDIGRDPNPHLSFGHGIHFCLGAALARLEARIALSDLLGMKGSFELDGDGAWEPRKALHVHGPANLPLRFQSS